MKEVWRPASEQDMKVILAGEKERAKTTMKTAACIEIILLIVILIVGSIIQMSIEDEIMRRKLGYSPSSERANQYYAMDEVYDLYEAYGTNVETSDLLDVYANAEARKQERMRQLRKEAQQEIVSTVAIVYSIIIIVLILIYWLVYCDTRLRQKSYKNAKLIVCNGVCKGKMIAHMDAMGFWNVEMEGRSQRVSEYANLWKIPTISVDLEDGTTKEVLVSKKFYENVSVGEKMLAVQYENTTRPDYIASIYCLTEE